MTEIQPDQIVEIIGGKHKKQYTGRYKVGSVTSKFSIVDVGIAIRVANKFLKPVDVNLLVGKAEVKDDADAQVNEETGEENPNFVYEEEWGKEDDGEEVYKNNYPEWSDVEYLENENEKIKQQLVKTQELLARSISNDKMIKLENQKLKELLQFYL
tara:strand:- start:876 stop:1343 length:468 start_codon:yes stop_codon:yes gene_type:complete